MHARCPCAKLHLLAHDRLVQVWEDGLNMRLAPYGYSLLSEASLCHIVGLGVESISEQWLRCITRALLLALIAGPSIAPLLWRLLARHIGV
jgi:hypothetical protein